jgi:hypothetical protein
MDTLVAQYGRPTYQSEFLEDLDELRHNNALDLKFAMPPIAKVGIYTYFQTS